MKIRYPQLVTIVTAATMTGIVGMAAFAASNDHSAMPSATTQEHPMPASQNPAPAQTGPAEKSQQGNRATVCVQLDTNHDGHISKDEFSVVGTSTAYFTALDVKGRGWLSLDQCTKALAG